jgi:hypothetical protein
MPTNTLYLAVQPLIHLNSGLAEQVLTLHPNREFATEFSPEEVNNYILMFGDRANRHLVGGNVIGYRLIPVPLPNGRVLVTVLQDVR